MNMQVGVDGVAGEGDEEKKPVPAWIVAAALASVRKRKLIDRTPDEFYYQHFTLPYVYSYYKVRLSGIASRAKQ